MAKALALLCAAFMVAAAGCAGGNETDYETLANDALDQANLVDVEADFDDSSDVVHVTGEVMSEADRQRVGDVVQQAVNNEVQVANEVTVRGGDTEAADDLDGGLETRLQNVMDADAVLRERDVEFDANNGVITITGNVPTEAEKARIEEMVRQQDGVRDVVNSLEIRPADAS